MDEFENYTQTYYTAGTGSQDTMLFEQTIVSNETLVEGGRNSSAEYFWMIGLEMQGQEGSYRIESILGEGGEAIIFLCSWGAERYVLKYYVNVRTMAREKREMFVALLFKQSSQYIVPLVDYGEYDHKLFDVYPYVKNGNLAENPVTLEFIRDVVVPNVNDALYLIHSYNIAHRDIKPNNILLSDDGSHVMLNDFSIMSIVEETTGGAYTTTAYRTNGYASPEILMMMPNKISDYYALGISLLSLINGGENLFKDMDEAMIYNCTVNGKIPKIDKEKFARMSHGSLSLRDRIEGLILGLTIYDHKKRWGYEEVKKWCAGEVDFPIIESEANSATEFSSPYIGMNGERLFTRTEIIDYLTTNWEASKQDLMRGIISGWFSTQRNDIASNINNMLEHSSALHEDNDCSLFRILYTIDQNYPAICWRGKQYKELSTLADDVFYRLMDISSALRCGLFSWMLSFNESFYSSGLAVADAFKEIEKIAAYDIETAKYLFAYQFMPSNIKREFYVGKYKFDSIDSLVEALFDVNTKDKISSRAILTSASLGAWMTFKGYGQVFNTATVRIAQANEDECYKRMILMLSNISENPRIKELLMNKSNCAHLFWIRDNIDQYEFFNPNAIAIKNKILGVNIYDGISVEELYDTINILGSCYTEFVQQSYVMPHNIACGVVPSNILDGAKKQVRGIPSIFPKTAGAALVYQKGSTLLPAGYVHDNKIEGCTDNWRGSSILKSVDAAYNDIQKKLNEEESEINDVYNRYYARIPLKIAGLIVLTALLVLFGAIYGKVYLTIGLIGLAYPIYRFFELLLCMKNAPLAIALMDNVAAYRNRVDWWKESTAVIINGIKSYYDTKSSDVLSLNIDECSYYTDSANMVKNAFKSNHLRREESPICRILFGLTTCAIAAIVAGGLIFGEFVYDMIDMEIEQLNWIEVYVIAGAIIACGVFDTVKLKGKQITTGKIILYPLLAIGVVIGVGGIVVAAIGLVSVLIQIFLAILGVIVIVAIVGALLSE